MRTQCISEEIYCFLVTRPSVLMTLRFFRAPCIRAFLSNLSTVETPSKFPNAKAKKSMQFVDSASFVNNVKTQILRGLKTNMDANVFQVTEKADQMIQQFFQEKKEKPVVRVFLSQGG
jgi:hypothetical protein